MPIHDWTRVDSGTYHSFHQDWTIEICRTLNRGVLPDGYFAMTEQRVSGPEPDVVALHLRDPETMGGLAVAEAPPRLRRAAELQTEAGLHARKANRVVVRRGLGPVVAAIELLSPGNKDSQHARASFVAKAVDLLRNGIHLLVIDPFPPGARDPRGVPDLIWGELAGERLPARPDKKPLTVASFDAGWPLTAYEEGADVGETWPEPPLFLRPGWYVNVPLEETYMASWGETPRPIRDLVAPSPPESSSR